jgi:NAD(P)-dependent dehydrogenase (short-subunit alcohol dehydrogenase family)
VDQHPDFKSGKISLRENLIRTYQTNVFGLACLSEAALPLLAKSTFPRIINISSGLGSLTTMSDKDGPRSSFRFVVRASEDAP